MKAKPPRRPKQASKSRRDYMVCNPLPLVRRLWSVSAISDRTRSRVRVYSQSEVDLFNTNL